MRNRGSLVGACVGAVVGGISRAAVAYYHLTTTNQDPALVVLIASVIGIIIGALAGVIGKPLLGAAAGALLAVLFFLVNLPIVMFFQFLGALTAPSFLEVVGTGALAGAIGGAVGGRRA